MSKRCVVCDDNPGVSQDPSGEWWCDVCSKEAAEFAALGGVSLDIARETLHATVEAWKGIDAMTVTEFDEVFSEGEPVKIVTGPSTLGYVEKVDAPLTWDTVVALKKELGSGNPARFKRPGERP